MIDPVVEALLLISLIWVSIIVVYSFMRFWRKIRP